MKKLWKTIALWVIISLCTGLLAGILSREGTEIYSGTIEKPPLSPPRWLFPVVWSILYILMGIGTGLVAWEMPSIQRSRGLNLMVTQLTVNFFWPLLFFNAQAFGFAFLWLLLLLGLVIAMTWQFKKVAPLSAKLQIPYILWLCFAAYLNFGVWLMNR